MAEGGRLKEKIGKLRDKSRDPVCGKNLKTCPRSLEILVSNETEMMELEIVEKNGQYFYSGCWFEHFSETQIGPGKYEVALVKNRTFTLTGVSGGLMFKIKKNGIDSGDCLIIGFINPTFGRYKTYITVDSYTPSAQYGYDNAKDDSMKNTIVKGYKLRALIQDPVYGANKMMVFQISDAP